MYDWDSMAPYFGGVLNANLLGVNRRALAAAVGRQQAAARPQLRPGLQLRPGAFARPAGPALSPAYNPVLQALAENPLEAARGDDVYYGLDTGSAGVNGGSTASLSTTPQKRHIPKRMTVSSTVANNFVISDIRVGVEPVLATTSNMSMAIFIQDATAPSFRAVICEVGMDFTIVITNVTGANARFTASVVGTYLPPAGC